MRRTALLLLLMAFLTSPNIWPEEPSPADPAQGTKPAALPDLKPLIAKLGSDDVQVREEATRELVKIGRSAYPEFKKAAESEIDLETKIRLKEVLAACSIRLGVLLPISEDEGKYWLEAVKMAFEDEGQEGLPVMPLYADDKGTAATWSEQANILVKEKHCVALLSALSMAEWRGVATASDTVGVPMIWPLTYWAYREVPSKWLVRIGPNIQDEGIMMANFAAGHLHCKNAAVIWREPYTQGEMFTDAFIEAWEARGLKFKRFTASMGSSEFYKIPDESLKEKPDLIVLGDETGVPFMKTGKVQWKGIPRVCLREAGHYYGLAEAAPFLGDTYFPDYFHSGENRPELNTFIERCKEKTGEEAYSHFVLAYDGARFAIRTLREAQFFEPEILLTAFKNAKPFKGITQVICPEKDGQVQGTGVVLRATPDRKHEFKGRASYAMPTKDEKKAEP